MIANKYVVPSTLNSRY